MTYVIVRIAALLLITLLAGIHGVNIKPSITDSNVDNNNNSATDRKILLAKAGLTVGQCTAACRTGVRAMQAFCRVVPHPAVRAACWAVTHYAGTTSVAMCTGFCYNYFG